MGTGARLAGWLWGIGLALTLLLLPGPARAVENGGTPGRVWLLRASAGMTRRALFAETGRFI